MILSILFYTFSSVLIASSFMVITAQNAVYSVLFLVLSFLSASILLFLLKCEFLSLIFILVYVGAIAILFVFVVMMLDLKTNSQENSIKYFPFGFIIGSVFVAEIVLVVAETFKENPYKSEFLSNFFVNWYDKIDVFTEIQAIGQIVYTQYVLQFLIAGNVLLLATLAAVVLTVNTDTNNDYKTQVIFKQLSRNYKNVLIKT